MHNSGKKNTWKEGGKDKRKEGMYSHIFDVVLIFLRHSSHSDGTVE